MTQVFSKENRRGDALARIWSNCQLSSPSDVFSLLDAIGTTMYRIQLANGWAQARARIGLI